MTPSDSLIQRILVGGIAIIMFLMIVYYAHTPLFGWIFTPVLGVVVSMALWEYYQMSVAMNYRPMIRTGIWGAGLYLLACWTHILNPDLLYLPGAVLLILLLIAFLLQLPGNVDNPLPNLAITIFGIAYIVMPLASILYVTYFPFKLPGHDGRWWLLYLVLVTKMTDIGGFAIGKTFGKTPLAPRISPKKTVEGTLGGVIFATIASVVVTQMAAQAGGFPSPIQLSLISSILMGILIGGAAQMGDLAESLLKRNAGVKDSSHLPGLGGILDIMDSMIFTAPIIFLYLSAMQN